MPASKGHTYTPSSSTSLSSRVPCVTPSHTETSLLCRQKCRDTQFLLPFFSPRHPSPYVIWSWAGLLVALSPLEDTLFSVCVCFDFAPNLIVYAFGAVQFWIFFCVIDELPHTLLYLLYVCFFLDSAAILVMGVVSCRNCFLSIFGARLYSKYHKYLHSGFLFIIVNVERNMLKTK